MRNIGAKSVGSLLACLLLGVASGTTQRHLTYAYAAYPTAHQTGPVTSFTGPGTGTMDITILGRAPDGGTSVEARDWWWDAVRPQQTAQCEIYDNNEISCAEFPVLSDAQGTLLPLLSRAFYPDASTSQWQQRFSYPCLVRWQTSQCSVDMTYTAARGTRGIVEIAAQGTYYHAGLRSQTIQDQASITYDPVAALPILVHDTKTARAGIIFGGRSVDLKLLHDSSGSN